MKKITLLLAIGFLSSSLLFQGCKKGEDDPTLSFKSRKARVAGDWTVTGYSSTGKYYTTRLHENGTQENCNVDYTSTYNGNVEAEIFTRSGNYCPTPSSEKNTYYTKEFTFDKDGSFTKTTVFTDYTTAGDKMIKVEKGRWDFMQGVGDIAEKKEQIFIEYTEYNTTYTDAAGNETATRPKTYASGTGNSFFIKRLHDEEMVLVWEEKGFEEDIEKDIDGNIITITSDIDYDYEWNFKAKN